MKSVLCIHIPKTGGIALREALVQSDIVLHWGNGHVKISNWQKKRRGKTKKLSPRFPLEGLFVTSIIRNPYARFRSIFWYHYNMRKTNPFWSHSWKVRGHLRKHYCTFEQFCLAFPEERALREDSVMFHTQYSYLQQENGMGLYPVDHLMRHESLYEDYLKLQQKLNTNLTPLETRNITYYPSVEEEYTDEMKAVVRRFYQIDFEAFGYAV